MNIFEQASRSKLRFDTAQGYLSVEDLWELPLQTIRANRASLDNIAVALSKELKDSDQTSFVDDAPITDDNTKLAFDIVLHVIAIRKEENKAEETKRTNAEKKQKILAIIADKQDEDLKGKPLEELQALLGSL